MSKNHYLPQLIINRFSSRRFKEPIDVFDVKTHTVIKGKRADKVFVEKNIYDDDVEKLIARVEQRFAEIIDKKIIGKEKIRITRDELYLIKRFLIINSIRAYSPGEFSRVIEDFSVPAELYCSLDPYIDPIGDKISSLPLTNDMGWTPHELLMNALRLYALYIDECYPETNGRYIQNHELCTRELYCWTQAIMQSYVVFADAAEGQEFLLSSSGMTYEYEPSFHLFSRRTDELGNIGGLSLSKSSYLQHMMNSKFVGQEETIWYMKALNTRALMYENFQIFNLTSTRCIVLVNPFFKLYNDYVGNINGKKLRMRKPDIWPSFFETREIARTPEVSYVIPWLWRPNDVFTYRAARLSVNDTILVNYLIFSTAQKLIGISDIEKTYDSVMTAICLESLSDKRTRDSNSVVAIESMNENLKNHTLNKLLEQFPDAHLEPTVDYLGWCMRYGDNCIRDVRRNRYVLEDLLKNEDRIREWNDVFGFLGDPDERIASLKNDLKNLKKY